MSSTRFSDVIARFDTANAADPNQKELVYAERMTAWQEKLYPDASEPLRLAVRSQHIERWAIPRDRYPEGRQGYKQWRTDLAKHHAHRAGALMAEAGYDEAEIARVQALLRKEKLKVDPEAQALEDVACLVFLENYFADFAKRYVGDEEKIVEIVRRTWIKMSDRGHEAALGLPLSEDALGIVKKAIGGPQTTLAD